MNQLFAVRQRSVRDTVRYNVLSGYGDEVSGAYPAYDSPKGSHRGLRVPGWHGGALQDLMVNGSRVTSPDMNGC